MRKVLLVGWDGAGWNRIHPLLDSGAMPNLARIVEDGVIGHLAALTPLCSPLLWSSVATGHFADRHGILDAVEPDPITGGVRPVTRASLLALQVQDILAQQGVRCLSIGWPATHPAKGPGTCVSDGFVSGAPDSIYPPSLSATLTPLRFDPREWTGADLQLFVPDLARIDQDKDKRLARLAIALAETVSTHTAATTLMEAGEWDFSAVWFGAVARAIELFPAGSDPIYKDAVDGVYRFLDLLLGRLLALAGPDAVTILLSDRSAGEPEWQASTGHGSRAILCAAGPGIPHDELVFGSGLLDIAPTLLGLFGFAPATGMTGRAIPGICRATPSREISGVPVPAAHAPRPLPHSDLEELEDLGYIDSVEAANRPAANAARTRREFHLAQVLLAQERPAEAIPLLERIASENPDRVDFRLYLAQAYLTGARPAESRKVCEALVAEQPDSPLAPMAWAHLAIAEGDLAEARKHLSAASENYGIAAALDSAIGLAYLRTENWSDAATAFRSALRTDPWMSAAHEGLARALVNSAHFEEAAEAALDAIRLRYDRADAHAILGTALGALGREDAAACAFAASGTLSRREFAALS